MKGSSKLELDKNTVNILLKEFASRPGREVYYENGEVVVNSSGLKLSVTELPLANSKVDLSGSFGQVRLEVTGFDLEPGQIRLQVDLEA